MNCDSFTDTPYCDHPGYQHAQTVQEIDQAAGRSDPIFDRDGDQLVRLKVSRTPEGWMAKIWYSRPGETEVAGSYTVAEPAGEHPGGYVLIPIPPVTDEELAEVYRSLGAPMPEEGA